MGIDSSSRSVGVDCSSATAAPGRIDHPPRRPLIWIRARSTRAFDGRLGDADGLANLEGAELLDVSHHQHLPVARDRFARAFVTRSRSSCCDIRLLGLVSLAIRRCTRSSSGSSGRAEPRISRVMLRRRAKM